MTELPKSKRRKQGKEEKEAEQAPKHGRAYERIRQDRIARGQPDEEQSGTGSLRLEPEDDDKGDDDKEGEGKDEEAGEKSEAEDKP